MKESWIMKTVAINSNGAKEVRYNLEPNSDDVTLEELKALAKFLNEYIKKEEEGGVR